MGGQSKNIPMKMDAQLVSVDFSSGNHTTARLLYISQPEISQIGQNKYKGSSNRQKHSGENISYSRAGKVRIRRYQVRAATLN